MSGPVLEIDKLTIRFGGLTAVSDVSLKVEPGTIQAVIGPNGAGKTTLFNAVSGVYEPTEGFVKFEGTDLTKSFEPKLVLWWSLAGLLLATFLTLFIADIDRLWFVAVKDNYRDRSAGFSVPAMIDGAISHMKAEPRIELRMGRLFLVNHDGSISFGSTRSASVAAQRLEALERCLPSPASCPEAFPDSDPATIAEKAEAAKKGASSAILTRWMTFVIGLFLGALGAAAVWRQTRRTPTSVASRGIARTFQNIRLFQEMTVLENVLVGMDRHLSSRDGRFSLERLKAAAPFLVVGGLLVALSLTSRSDLGMAPFVFVGTFASFVATVAQQQRRGHFSNREVRRELEAREEARSLLTFVGLADKASDLSRNLAYGDQRRLEIARALATKPKLLLLDEPAAGMNPTETVGLMKLIKEIRDRGITVLLIEHHMRVVMGISDRIAVLEYGRKIAEGTPEEIRQNPKVIEAYLGKEDVE